MPQLRMNLINICYMIILAVLASAFQSTFWFQIFKSLPAPWVWLNVFLYILLYRKASESIWILYGLCLFIAPFSSIRISVLWLITCIIYFVISEVKKRIFWPGVRYFFYASIGINFLFQAIYVVYSKTSEPNPASVMFFHRLGEILLSSLFSFPIYWICSRIDLITHKEFLPEAGGTST